MKNTRNKQLGFTLMEALSVVAISGLIAAMSSPMVKEYAREREVSKIQTAFAESLGQAREHAASMGTRVGLCPSSDGLRCADGRWSDGWLVYDTRAERLPGQAVAPEYHLGSHRVDGNELVLEVIDEDFQAINRIQFDEHGYSTAHQQLAATSCERSGDAPMAVTLIERTGRIRSNATAIDRAYGEAFGAKLQENAGHRQLACL